MPVGPDFEAAALAKAASSGVAGEGAVAHGRRPSVDGGAPTLLAGVAGEGAVAQHQCPVALKAAAEAVAEGAVDTVEVEVTREGAVAHSRRPAILVLEAAAVAGGVAGE